ncbi:hypothetical protein RB213_009073 [Colletotrichum asianum]
MISQTCWLQKIAVAARQRQPGDAPATSGSIESEPAPTRRIGRKGLKCARHVLYSLKGHWIMRMVSINGDNRDDSHASYIVFLSSARGVCLHARCLESVYCDMRVSTRTAP